MREANHTKNPDSKVTGSGPTRCFAFLEVFFPFDMVAAGFLLDAMMRELHDTACSTCHHRRIVLIAVFILSRGRTTTYIVRLLTTE